MTGRRAYGRHHGGRGCRSGGDHRLGEENKDDDGETRSVVITEEEDVGVEVMIL